MRTKEETELLTSGSRVTVAASAHDVLDSLMLGVEKKRRCICVLDMNYVGYQYLIRSIQQ